MIVPLITGEKDGVWVTVKLGEDVPVHVTAAPKGVRELHPEAVGVKVGECNPVLEGLKEA